MSGRRSVTLPLLAWMGLLLNVGLSQAGPLTLVKNGETSYRIVVDGASPLPERFAAEELRRYLFDMSGADLPIYLTTQDPPSRNRDHAIVLGHAAPGPIREELSGLPEDAFLIRTMHTRLILAGACPRATLYAVYTFLEDLGVGFPRPGQSYLKKPFNEPGPQEETVPKKTTIAVAKVDRLEKPSFSYRAILTFPMIRDRAVREIDWLAKNRLNWVHLITNTDLSVWEKEQVREVLMPEIRKRGIHVQGIGHSFYAYVPPKKYQAQHLEYFAMMDGERRTEHRRGATLCVSNPEVVRVMTENMSAFLRENPEIEIIDLWNNDGLGWCECPRCREMNGCAADSEQPYTSITRGYLRFVNEVAGELAKRHPGVKINALAYGFTLHPDPLTPPAHNVIVGIAPWSRVCYAESDDYYVPITEPGPVNDYLRIAIPNWARQRASGFYIYDYYGVRYEFFPIIDTVRKDYAWYKKLGIDMLSSETFMWDEFNLWAYTRLAWDHQMPLRKVVADFCRIAYRAAAEPMEDFHLLLERRKWEWPKHRDELAPLLKDAQAKAEAAGDVTIQAKLKRMAELLAQDPQKSWPHKHPPPPLED